MSEDLKHIVKKFCPVLVFHPEERFLCCKPEWFVKQCKLVKVVVACKDSFIVKQKQKCPLHYKREVAGLTRNASFGRGYRLRVENKDRRSGQGNMKLCNVPLFAKMKKMQLQSGETVLEINYIAFFAYSGPHKIVGKQMGDHDGDWGHITVRCTPDGRLIAVYYSAHRHSDSTWVAAKNCHIDETTGRLVAFVSLNGHGMYPRAGMQPRNFFLGNDKTSSAGRVWGCKECVILAHPGTWLTKGNVELKKIPEVPDRGVEYSQPYDAPLKRYKDKLSPRNDDPASLDDVEVSVPGTDWMHWNCRWGEIAPPWTQDWFKQAEQPESNNVLKRTLQPWKRST